MVVQPIIGAAGVSPQVIRSNQPRGRLNSSPCSEGPVGRGLGVVHTRQGAISDPERFFVALAFRVPFCHSANLNTLFPAGLNKLVPVPPE
jgi:hypothetical protein